MDEIHTGYAQLDDLPSWMALVRTVRREFPGLETEAAMAEHRAIAAGNIARKTALCAKTGTRIVGTLLYSKNRDTLSFLAVDPAYRKQGVASTLIRRMLEDFDPTNEVWVTTFREEDPKGNAPRSLYLKFGFIEDELVEEFGYPCQKFVLRRA